MKPETPFIIETRMPRRKVWHLYIRDGYISAVDVKLVDGPFVREVADFEVGAAPTAR